MVDHGLWMYIAMGLWLCQKYDPGGGTAVVGLGDEATATSVVTGLGVGLMTFLPSNIIWPKIVSETSFF